MLGTQKGRSITVNNAFDSYHNYTLEWTPIRMRIFVDGVQ